MVAVVFQDLATEKIELKKYHIIYKTTNKINGKFYIGVHSTNNLNDNYLGSGWVLKAAIKKYGKENFIKEILFIYDSRQLAMKKEAELVNEDFIKDNNNYNLTLGGNGVVDQWGERNHMWGKVAPNAKRVKATYKDGTVVVSDSIDKLSKHIQIARGNIRNLLKKGIVGKRGWKVEYY